MNNSDRNYIYFLLGLIVCVCSTAIHADSEFPLVCSVSDTRDEFNVYPDQRTYESEEFSHYQLISGLTILVLNNKTMRFNRLSNLNLLAHSTMDPSRQPDNYQMFSGTCKVSKRLGDS